MFTNYNINYNKLVEKINELDALPELVETLSKDLENIKVKIDWAEQAINTINTSYITEKTQEIITRLEKQNEALEKKLAMATSQYDELKEIANKYKAEAIKWYDMVRHRP